MPSCQEGGTMIELKKLKPYGRKVWAKTKWDEYINSRNYLMIKQAKQLYEDPSNEVFAERLDRSKWKSTVDKKVNYLLARKPVCSAQELLDSLSEFIRKSATEYTLRGSLIWIVQGDGESLVPVPMIMDDTLAVYADKNKEEVVAFVRRIVDIEVEPETGAETEVEYFECYYEGDSGWLRDTYCFSRPEADSIAEPIEPVFIELGKTGDAPLFAYVENTLLAMDRIMKHQDTTVDKNTAPLTEVRGYSGTSDADLEYAVNNLKIVKTDGQGGVTVHQRSMDSNSIDIWRKSLQQEYAEATCIVTKDNELQYAMSGKAMDRLFVDMENDARRLAHVLEEALLAYFAVIGEDVKDITWNTDRPVDDAAIINAIVQSKGIISDETLMEQHPWVTDVEEEKKRMENQNMAGMLDLTDDNGEY